MGANHNFFNSVWTPGKYPYSTSDDWSDHRSPPTPICGTGRCLGHLHPAHARRPVQGRHGVHDRWFRMTARWREPASCRCSTARWLSGRPDGPDIRSFADGSGRRAADHRPLRAASARWSAPSGYGHGDRLRQPLGRGPSRTRSRRAPGPSARSRCRTGRRPASWQRPGDADDEVPWTTRDRHHRPSLTRSPCRCRRQRNASGFDALSVKIAADDSVVTGTDLTLTVMDGSGAT